MIVKRGRERRSLLFLAALLPVSAIAQTSSLQKAPDFVWTWSKQCDATQKLGISIRLEGKTLYRGVIPICRGHRDTEDGRLEFHFNSRHLFAGQFRARQSDTIEGDIWQAGGETDALILGISFMTKKQILLNTLHVARPDKQTSAELDKGLYISTYPVIDH